MRRGVNMTYIVENNGVYGLTKGQFSATSDRGAKSRRGVENKDEAIDLVGMALQLGATFVARSFSGDKDQLVPLIEAALKHQGAAFIDCISPCVAFNNHEGSHTSFDYVREHNLAVNYLDPATWFDFDRLLFDTGSATLQPASEDQLHSVAAILAAYPKVKIKIGGYTDNTGDQAANLKLSQDRADSVKAELQKLGVAPDRMESQGYGEDHPVADNTTDEGRQKNRRISLRVTEK